MAAGLLFAAGCAKNAATSPKTASIRAAISAPEAVASVTVIVSDGAGFTREVALTRNAAGQWTALIEGLPAGLDLTVSVIAKDAAGTIKYEGSASVNLNAGTTASVHIPTTDADPTPTTGNTPPRITSVIIDPESVTLNAPVSLTVNAQDPDTGAVLTYLWQASGGEIATPAAASTQWIAPGVEGPVAFTITITDGQGAVVTFPFTLTVSSAGGQGGLQITISFNSAPNVSSITVDPERVDVGETATAAVVASDPDLDVLSYSWTADCAGTFSLSDAATVQFTPAEHPVLGYCTLTATVLDGRGATNTGTTKLWVGPDTIVGSGVTVSALSTYWSEYGTAQTLPMALTTVEALFPTATGYDRYTGTTDGLGNWTIPGVPLGTYLLARDNRVFFETSARHLDLNRDYLSRSNLVPLQNATMATFQVTLDPGLGSILSDDRISLIAPDACPSVEVYPNSTFNWALLSCGPGMAAGLVNPTDLFRALYLRSTPTNVPGVNYRRAVGAATFSGVTMTDGQPTTFPIAVTPIVPPDRSVALSWSFSSFERYLGQMGPFATLSSHRFEVDAAPGALRPPSAVMIGKLSELTLDLWGPPGRADTNFGALAYTQVLPTSSYTEYGVAMMRTYASRHVGTATPASRGMSISRAEPLSSLPNPFVPLISPVRNPQITATGGSPSSLDDRQTGVGTTPTITWSAPEIGWPTYYRVLLQEVYANAINATSFQNVGIYRVRSNQLRVPSGVMMPGRSYLVTITAYVEGTDLGPGVYQRQGIPYATADYLSEVFTP